MTFQRQALGPHLATLWKKIAEPLCQRSPNQVNCITLEIESDISKELNKKILKTAAIYKEENKKPKNKKKE